MVKSRGGKAHANKPTSGISSSNIAEDNHVKKAGKAPSTPAKQDTRSRHSPPSILQKSELTVRDIRQNPTLWYKTRVLIFDLYNISKYKICATRHDATVDELYISAPYYTEQEAAAVKSARVYQDAEDKIGISVEQAISSKLENFLEKRRPSGDSRPCGPHDMAPVYLEVFGMDMSEIKEDTFVARVKRARALPAV